MVWKRLPPDVQKAVLAMIVFLGGAGASCRLGPVICDPAPPPSSTPTPLLCDPPPPPPTATAPVAPPPSSTPTLTPTLTATPVTPVRTPMICDPPPLPATLPPTPLICDPAPLPALSPVPTLLPNLALAPGQHFTARTLQVAPGAVPGGTAVRGTLVDAYGVPLGGLPVVARWADGQAGAVSGAEGTFFLRLPGAGTYTLVVAGDAANALPLELRAGDVVTVEGVEHWEGAQAPLPLAEVRTVEIVWQAGLTFAAESPWDGARYRWSASGGTLDGTGGQVSWQLPSEPGRYLLQVVADWGRTGLAVDALTVTVEDDGSLILG